MGDGAIQWVLADEAATQRWGAALARAVGGGMLITLSGDLGAGKSTLVRGLLRQLGVAGPLKSPTYGLVETYAVSSLYLYHFDFYRIEFAESLEDRGFREYFRNDSLCLVEWPERGAGWLPPPDVALRLELAGDGRGLRGEFHGAMGQRCLHALTDQGWGPGAV